MAINRIQGNILADDLVRGANLSVQGNLVYFDITNSKVGVLTSSPDSVLTVNGNATVGNITIDADAISSDTGKVRLGSNAAVEITGGASGQILSTDGAGNLSWTAASNISGLQGNTISLGTPTDGDLTTNVAYDQWSTSTFVTDGLDDLNQVALNIANGTYVGQVDFSGTPVAGASPMSVSFVGEYVGNPNSFLWDFGDGNTSTAGSSVSHSYSDVNGGQFTVSFTAFNTNGTYSGNASLGAKGSVDSEEKTNYITLYTPNPIPGFTITDNTIDSASNAEITNTSQYATSYELDWGDGVGNIDPGDSWTTVENTYTNAGGDEQYTITLYAISNTAGPSPVTVSTTDTIDVFSTHTATFAANTIRVINEESTSGGVVQFENTTATDPGSTATFGSGQKYLWTWGDGDSSNINIQSGLAGNPGAANLSHTFALSSGEQSAGTTATFDVNLSVYNGHTSSPFVSSNVTITVEPDVRADFTATANVISDRSGDTAQTGYVYTDYRNGLSRAEFQYENQSQNGDVYDLDWGDSTTTGNINAGDPGTPGFGNLTHTYTGTGFKTMVLDAYGTPDTIAQTDTDTKSNYINIKTNPTAPGALSTKTLSMSTGSQGTSPKLAALATDNTPGNIVAAGTTVTRYTTNSPINSSTVSDVNTSVSGSLTSFVNGSNAGNVTFSSAANKSGTYDTLVISDDRDAHDAISSSTYPSGFYKVFDASISEALADLGVGYNDYKLSHSSTGDTNTVGFVKDDMTSTPTVVQTGATISETTSGTYRYISGVPYYNSGSPTITVSGLQVQNLVGQTYRNTSAPLQYTSGTILENSGTIISTQQKTYSQIDGASSMLTGGIPNAGTGVSSNYTMGDMTLTINGSARAVGYVDAQMFNVNGSSSIIDLTDKKIQVYNQSLSGFDESNIPVSDDLGSVYDDDGLRVALGLSGDTPAFSGVTNFYTTDAWSGAETVAGTDEAIVRWGTLQHYDDADFSTGYLPVGPDLVTGRSGAQYFTFAFRRATMANFDIAINSSTGISGLWIAAPGTAIDSASTLNGWIDGTIQYAGAGVPGADTGNGGNGSNGCALTGADVIPTGTSINASYTMTLGSENGSNATGNNILVRIRLDSGETLTSISVGVAV